MKLQFIELGKLTESRANMRSGKRPPDIANILPSVRQRGIIQTLLVRPIADADRFEIVAGRRRYHAALAVAEEGATVEPLPCAILDEGDDASALEASMIENFARLDPDEVARWETFTRLVKEGRATDDIAATFGLSEPAVRRILALGNLLPRIRDLYRREEIDVAAVRHLTMASKARQRDWLALFDDPDVSCPTGHRLKAWLFGGAAIPAKTALFDLESYSGELVSDLFGEDRFFADADQFWTAQNAEIEARRTAFLDAGWADAIIVPPSEYFQNWDYEKAGKRKGGRVYIDVRASGEVTFHEGYISRSEARRIARGEGPAPSKPQRPEVTGTMQTYLDLHRHAAVRAALTGHPHVALRLMVAHAIVGSRLWNVRREPQASRNGAVAHSVAASAAEAAFDERRRAVLALLGRSPDEPTVTGGNGDDHALTGLFLRLLDLPDAALPELVAIVMGETLASGGPAVEAVGARIGVDMATVWQADDAFFDLIRDREVLGAIVAEVAGETVAAANAQEKATTLKTIVRDHLAGSNGRAKVDRWVPRWLAFPPSAYTARGGVGSVKAHAVVAALDEERRSSRRDPAGPGGTEAVDELDRLAA